MYTSKLESEIDSFYLTNDRSTEKALTFKQRFTNDFGNGTTRTLFYLTSLVIFPSN